ARARRDRRRRALPLPGRHAPLRRQQPLRLRRDRRGAAPPARARLSLEGRFVSGGRNWQAGRLEEIERRDGDIPVREHFGIHAFGINAYERRDGGMLIGAHDEIGAGQEELYIVLEGTATFEIDGETFDAPAGTFV